ncbi:MAG TPA: 23S rRNA (adenine(2030)-N(6))-methyltransferase RlmJ [Methylocella sp.]|nr:23S rRNA (adenine(2030)-N(6))-methyltransferase RlmJ [Methylocella sp.]
MNYRHEFHAGNFADVFKHILLSRILLYLRVKPSAFRCIETHAGSGLYALGSAGAGKPAEWRGGIGRLAPACPDPLLQELLGPYLEIEAPLLQTVPPHYAGSPLIARALLRRQDRMLLCELHPRAFENLKAVLGKEPGVKLFAINGYMGLRAFVPPKERRGLVLIDPPFEDPGEFETAADELEKAWRKWPGGIYMLWYPVKDMASASAFSQSLAQRGIKRILRLEFQVSRPAPQLPLARCGAVIVNPPYLLPGEAGRILPWLADCLGAGEPGFSINWLEGP